MCFRTLTARCTTQIPSYMNKLSPTSLLILSRDLLQCSTISLEEAFSDNKISWTICSITSHLQAIRYCLFIHNTECG